MSLRKKTIESAAVAVILAVGIIAASYVYLGAPIMRTGTTGLAAESALAIRLTDPPQVPSLTSSLNLTYSSLTLLVGEPTGTQGQLSTKSVEVTPSGGSATVDLLKLQNVSQTIATADLPNGSLLFSVTFNVTSIAIDVNGTVAPVALATGGSGFTVTIASPSEIGGGDFALLQLNPVVVDTPSGYELIPSAVGVMGHSNAGHERVGDQHQISNEDNMSLEHARGNVTATLVALSVSGNVTTVTVRVNNTGTVPVQLMGIGLHGNFTASAGACQSSHQNANETDQSHHTETDTNATHTEANAQGQGCETPEHPGQVVFVPVMPSTTAVSSSAGCTAGQMSLVNGSSEEGRARVNLTAGQCVELTFAGYLGFGESHLVLTPSTAAGQVYVLHVIASSGANQLDSCTLPLGPGSCEVTAPQPNEDQ